MTYDPVSVHAEFAARENIAYPLLSDKDSAIIRAFGLLNPQFPEGSSWHGVALPAIFVIDREGIITHRFSTGDYRDRPEPEAVIDALRKAGG